MPQESDDVKLARIKSDLAYFSAAALACLAQGQPMPTVYADKYSEDVSFLLNRLVAPSPSKSGESPKEPVSDLERGLADDQALRDAKRGKR